MLALTDERWAERCSGWTSLLPYGRVSQTGRIYRSLVCRVGQANISSLEAAVGTPSGQASHWGLVFSPFCFSLKLSNPSTAAHTARTSPFAWRCARACSLPVQVGHLIGNPAQPSPCTGTPATLLSSKVAFLDHEGRRGHFLYTALPYVCAAGRGEGVTEKSYGGLTTHSHFSFLPGEGEPHFHSFFFFLRKKE